ncbi:phosphate ABC transporter substrate-binding protein PstS [Saccharomonospora sp. NPDC046836]|uniref:phosphate ABC transporter substrate-binding protein PstS n=1 Tax=Saccharomonospora sp. NPDC046836 TaxID=3156921 RepID=UPI0033F43DF2
MSTRDRRWRMLLATLLAAVLTAWASPAAMAQNYVPISGAGSTWSFNALDQWRKNVLQYGMRISYSGTGSTDGRNQFKAGQVDFAVSEIPYGLMDNGVRDSPPTNRGFAYMPIVAGGTSFMYNLTIGGKRVTNLRLSGEVLAKIFTGAITNWADPAIKADNPGLQLPARKVVPVVRSDGSGTTAQLTMWFAAQHGGIWDAYCRKAGRSAPCGSTSDFPITPAVVGQSGSLGVTSYVRQQQSEGSITYVEYSYARNAGFPVAKVLNQSNYYIEPTAQSVAVALLQARIAPDLTQDLRSVYTSRDRRAYPLSSYSYMILPTTESGKFNRDKGRTLSDFAYYFLCEGQQQADRLGYSPLPINLVTAGMQQVARIPGSTRQRVDISKCNNPTFSRDGSNTLARTAPNPSECDRKGATQCAQGTGGARQETPVGTGTGRGTGTGTGTASRGQGTANQTGGPAGNTGTDPAAQSGQTGDSATGPQSQAAIDPETGEVIGGTEVLGASAIPVSVQLRDNNFVLLSVLAVVLLTGLIIGPPLIARALRRKEGP